MGRKGRKGEGGGRGPLLAVPCWGSIPQGAGFGDSKGIWNMSIPTKTATAAVLWAHALYLLSALHRLSHLESLRPQMARCRMQPCPFWGLLPTQDSNPGSQPQKLLPWHPPEVLLPDPQIVGCFSRRSVGQEFPLSFGSLKPQPKRILCSLLSTWPNSFCLWAWLFLSQGREESLGGKVNYSLKTWSHLIGDGQRHPLLLATYFTLFSPPSPAANLHDVIKKRTMCSEDWLNTTSSYFIREKKS